MSKDIIPTLSFGEFAGQLAYDKTFLLMIVLPLLIFASFIQSKLDLFTSEIFNQSEEEGGEIKVNLNRAMHSGDHGDIVDPSDTMEGDIESIKTFLAKFLLEYHPYLTYMIEYKDKVTEFLYYWGLLIVGLAAIVSAMYVIEIAT